MGRPGTATPRFVIYSYELVCAGLTRKQQTALAALSA